MTERHDTYRNPLADRYAGPEMARLFSDNNRHTTWRRLWIALAEAQHEIGLKNITGAQIDEMKAHLEDIPYDEVRKLESRIRHDVMAHLRVFGEQCPGAKPIMHLGATSAYVLDNTDLIIMRGALEIIKKRLAGVIDALSKQAGTHRDLVTVAFTHYQPAQLTTVGKRACLWLQDFLLDLEDLEYRVGTLKFRGVKGATGTQDSFMALLDGDSGKIKRLEELVAKKMGFSASYPVTGQTYSRKIDSQALALLSGIAQSAHKFSNDVRLLQNLREAEEPFEAEQVGSSAMPYKRNPVLSERTASLARLVICGSLNPAFNAAGQWFERTLDDSANRRISIPETFMATEGLLTLVHNVAAGLKVNPNIIEHHVRSELPFLATERILMAAVKGGGDRQELHERIRVHAMEAVRLIKEGATDNDLLDRIAGDPKFSAFIDRKQLDQVLDPGKFVGRAPEQVDDFLKDTVAPVLKRHKHLIEKPVKLTV
ncbi:MAG: adenylosuccinate lyase [Candidatus Brocadiales bacterium]|nr:adenylosuccinate lyase [Candidatus Bathyanammoxibius amoris]